MSLWVFSPVVAIHHALQRYVAALGFDVELDAAKADAALFDLASLGSPLPSAPKLPTLALLGPANADLVEEALRAGYAVHLAHDGEEHLRMALASLLTDDSSRTVDPAEDDAPDDEPEDAPEDDARRPQVTPREAQVLSLLMLGLTNKRIAEHLMITERTVKFHVASLMRKNGVRNRPQLMLKNPIVVTWLPSGAPSRRR
jgi:DNA-binding NarL/FixJ family response regulator